MSQCSDLTFPKVVFVSEAKFQVSVLCLFSRAGLYRDSCGRSLCVPAFICVTERHSAWEAPWGLPKLPEQLAIVFLQKVPVPSQVQQPHRQFQVIVFQMLICKVALDQHRGYAARLGLLSGRP